MNGRQNPIHDEAFRARIEVEGRPTTYSRSYAGVAQAKAAGTAARRNWKWYRDRATRWPSAYVSNPPGPEPVVTIEHSLLVWEVVE